MSLGPWVLGSLGPWVLGSLGPWVLGSLGPWVLESLGPWVLEFLGPVSSVYIVSCLSGIEVVTNCNVFEAYEVQVIGLINHKMNAVCSL